MVGLWRVGRERPDMADAPVAGAISHPLSSIEMAGTARLHQTTIRFTPAIWEQVEAQARSEGVSAAQYVRDATLTSLAYGAGTRERDPDLVPAPRVRAGAAMLNAAEAREGSAAVWAQARLARDRARAAREAASLVRGRSSNQIEWR
jgi:hypothetical protein